MWKDIPDWKQFYEINEFGEVRNKITGRLNMGDINSAGYYRVCLYHNHKQKRYFRHRLVAQLFLPNPNNLPEVNHDDGDKSNNHVSNLVWCTRTENEREAHRIGIKKYKPFQVEFQNGIIKQYEFAIDLANEIGVTKRCVLNYLQGKSQGFVKYNILSIRYL